MGPFIGPLVQALNYRHIYHAGGLADIIKHVILAHLMKRLGDKPAAFCVLDSHAAVGLYDLSQEETKKTGEVQEGAFPFFTLPADDALAPFQSVLNTLNPDGFLRCYPGSPAIIRHYLRPQDRLIAVEKHADDAALLKRFFGEDPAIQIHARDAWEAMKALIPFQEGRSLVFIDPPYEQPDEMDKAYAAIVGAHQRSAHSMFALWYPLKDPVATAALHDRFLRSGIKKILRVDAWYGKNNRADKMTGSGMILINPPWQMETELVEALQKLTPLFERGSPKAVVGWLVD